MASLSNDDYNLDVSTWNDSSTVDTFPDNSTLSNASPESVVPFEVCILLIGAVGLTSNGLVLYILITNVSRKQSTNLLIMNQIALDMFACLFLIVCYAIQLTKKSYLTGALRLTICFLFESDMTTFVGLTGSICSLVFIALERYFMIVHPIPHRKHFKKWFVYVAICIAWTNGVLTNISVFWTSRVIDGTCYQYWFWPSEIVQVWPTLAYFFK